MKDHLKRELISRLCDDAERFASAPGLCEHIAGTVLPPLRALEIALTTLRQIESTPRNAGARRNARATLRFLETQIPELKDM